MFFPQGIKCLVCGRELSLDSDSLICDKCSLVSNELYCKVCGRSFKQTGKTGGYVCEKCRIYPPLCTQSRAPFHYEGDIRRLIHGFKYGNRRYLTCYLARLMMQRLPKEWEYDFITFAPMHKKRKRARGYNQAELLANELGRLLNKRVLNVLERVKQTANVAGLGRVKRFAEIQNTIKVIQGIRFNKQNILLIDDVLTSGATRDECCKQLKTANAGNIFVLTVATSSVWE